MSIYHVTRLVTFNTSILTAYGTFTFEPISSVEARALLLDFQQHGKSIESAIGHQSTADLLSMLLEYNVTVSRLEFKQTTDDLALIFKLKRRPSEGKILNRDEIDEIGYEFGLLSRTT